MKGPKGAIVGEDFRYAIFQTTLMSDRAACLIMLGLEKPTRGEYLTYLIQELATIEIRRGVEIDWIIDWLLRWWVRSAREDMSKRIQENLFQGGQGIVFFDMNEFPLEIHTQRAFFRPPEKYALNPCWWGADGFPPPFDLVVIDDNCATWWQ
jgi:hypothetical protein